MTRRLDVRVVDGGRDRSYAIHVDAELGAEARFAEVLSAHVRGMIAVVTDENVAALHLRRYAEALRARGWRVVEEVVPAGEGAKSLARVEALCESLAQKGLDRRALLVALGGGVVGDLAGFVAATFLRGVAYVQAPTTLLAQVDSSVGGKTGVNLAAGKNLVGAFYQPRLVYADLTTLATLSPRDRAAGLGEVVKHALIADAAMLELLEARAADIRKFAPDVIAELIVRSAALKARFVEGDEREEKGTRALLNFGHTVGHALESASHQRGGEASALRHGEAVALGMLAALRIGRALGGPDLEPRVAALLGALGLPIDLDARLSAESLAAIGVDKKRVGSPTANGARGWQGATEVSFVLVDAPGSARLERLALSRVYEILLDDKPG